MAPDVLARKLLYLRQLIVDLAPYQGASLAEVKADHYKIERLLELLVGVTVDIFRHLLAENDILTTSYRDTFAQAGQHGLLPADLTNRLQNAAGMRNVIVHLYEEIDYTVIQKSIDPALQDFQKVVVILSATLPYD